MSLSLTPEQKNATMNEERAFLTKLLESALQNRFQDLKTLVETYQRQHNNENNNKPLSCIEILSQFRDGKKRTALHFACQSVTTTKPQQQQHGDNGDSNDTHKNGSSSSSENPTTDIVEELLDWISKDSMTTAASLEAWIRLKDKDGLTPLMLAVQVQEDNDDDKTPILSRNATTTTTTTTIRERRVLVLLQRCKKLALARSKAGATALHYAASSGATRTTIQTLYQAGQIALHTSSRQGGTPLHWAVAVQPPAEYHETIRALLDCGAKVDAVVVPSTTLTSDKTTTMDAVPSIPPALHMATAAGNQVHAQLILDEIIQRETIDLQPTLEFLLPGGISIYHMWADMNWVSLLHTLAQQTPPSLWKRVQEELRTTDDKRLTAVQVAARERHVGPVLILLGEGHSEGDAKLFIQEFHDTKNGSGTNTTTTTSINTSTSDDQQQQQQPATAAAAAETTVNKNSEDNTTGFKKLEEQAVEAANSLLSTRQVVSELKKQEAQKHKEQGNQEYASNHWQTALDCYTAAIALDPTNATYYSNRSASYYKLEQYKVSLMDAIMARTLRPNWPKAAYRIAVARLALHQYEDAALAAFEGLKQDADNDELKQLVQQCVKKGRTEFQQQQQNKKQPNNQQLATTG